VKRRSKWNLISLSPVIIAFSIGVQSPNPANAAPQKRRPAEAQVASLKESLSGVKDAQGFLLGHNLTPTSYTLKQGQGAFGTYAIGYGFTDFLMIATSPFIWFGYNMANVAVRAGADVDSTLIDRIGVETIYFNTFNMQWMHYSQESIFIRATLTKQVASGYTVHGNFGFQYFMNSSHPFSLRPNPFENNPVTMNVGILHEINIGARTGFLAETAILGLNYKLPYAHLGLSFFWKNSTFAIQLGASASFRGSAEITTQMAGSLGSSAGTPQGALIASEILGDDYVPLNARHLMIHPEVQIQFTF